jgi:rhodanese-related sulfurtransferase
MKSSTILIIATITVLVIGLAAFFGWKWVRVLMASDYDEMLNALYNKTVPLMKPDEIIQLSDYLILDTRAKNEHAISCIEGAKWVGYSSVDLSVVDELPKDQAILVYCSVGYRSERIGEQLLKKGFTNVHNLYGGIFEWVNTNHSLVDQQNNLVQKVHGFQPSWGKWVKTQIDIVYD